MKKHIFIYILSLILLILVILLGLSENKLSKEVIRLNTEISSYKYAITQANDNIKEANAIIDSAKWKAEESCEKMKDALNSLYTVNTIVISE